MLHLQAMRHSFLDNLKTQSVLTERRDFDFSPDLIIAKDIEEQALTDEIYQALTQRILILIHEKSL